MSQVSVSSGDNTARAIAAIVAAVFALSLGDAVIKLISADFTLWQVFILRSVIAAPVLWVVILWQRVGAWPRLWFWTGLRSVMLAVMWVIYYASLPHMPLSAAAATYYTSPLFITLFAGLFVGDRIGFKGWFAVVLGFVGVTVIVRPAADDFNAYALLPLAAAILYALGMILTRTKCRGEHPLVLALSLVLAFPVVGGVASLAIGLWGPSAAQVAAAPFLLGDWAPLDGKAWLALGVLGTAMVIGALGAAIAYQIGKSSTVAIFDFSYLPFAVLWSVVFFADIPDGLTVTGIALIIIAGVLATRR